MKFCGVPQSRMFEPSMSLPFTKVRLLETSTRVRVVLFDAGMHREVASPVEWEALALIQSSSRPKSFYCQKIWAVGDNPEVRVQQYPVKVIQEPVLALWGIRGKLAHQHLRFELGDHPIHLQSSLFFTGFIGRVLYRRI
jgi:hypothetical protein